MLLEEVQIINEDNQPRFAVIDFSEYETLKQILTDEEKLEDYLDYLHIQKIKANSDKSYTLKEVEVELGLN